MSETQAAINEVIARIERRDFAHIALLVGSVVSAVGDSACATVPIIRDRLVIDALLRRFALPGATVETEVISLLTKLRRGSDHPLRQAVADLPFEQFMSCLHRVAPDQAHEIVGLACRTGSPFTANFNHRAVASLALSLQAAGFAQPVTVLTTNYDVGLESAWHESPGVSLEAVPYTPFPVSWVTRQGRRICRYGKLHGCINARDSLVYTFERLADVIFRPDRLAEFLRAWFPEPERTLVLSFGYGYNDPDLRPVFARLFTRDRAHVCRTERPVEASKVSPPNRLLGTEVLRQEMFDGWEVTTVPTNLYATDNENALRRLAERFGIGGAAPGTRDPPGFAADESVAMAAGILAHVQTPQVVEFLATLVDACWRADARELLEKTLAGLNSQPDPRWVELLLKQYGHAHDLPGAAGAAERIRSRWKSADVRVLCHASDSFAFSLDGQRPAWQRLALPWRSLRAARSGLGQATPRVQHLYTHYRGHFWLKLIQFAEAKLPPSALPVFRGLLRQRGRSLAQAFGAARRFTESTSDAQFASELGNLEAQALILAGEPQSAYETAVRAQALASALNGFHVALQIDRTIGWCSLAIGQTPDILRALRVFARGLLRATYAADPSLRAKLGVNCLRVALHLAKADISTMKTGVTPDASELFKSLHALHSAHSSDEVTREVIDILARDVLANCKVPDRAVFHLRRYADVIRYPVLLFEE
jgi:hypothetical protein